MNAIPFDASVETDTVAGKAEIEADSAAASRPRAGAMVRDVVVPERHPVTGDRWARQVHSIPTIEVQELECNVVRGISNPKTSSKRRPESRRASQHDSSAATSSTPERYILDERAPQQAADLSGG